MRRRKAQVDRKVRRSNREIVPTPEVDISDPRVQRGCVGKRVYLSKHRARVAISRIRKGLGSEQRMYHCRVCGKYHLSSTTARPAIKGEIESVEPTPTIQVANPTIRTLTGTTLKSMMKRASA